MPLVRRGSVIVFPPCAGGDPVNFSDPFGTCSLGSAIANVGMGIAIAKLTSSHYGFGAGAFDILTGCVGVGAISNAIKLRRLRAAAHSVGALARSKGGGRVVIGKMEDLGPGSIGKGERTLLSQLQPDLRSASANWARNERVLLAEMQKGVPIRDASVDPITGNLLNESGFLAKEREVLRAADWTYDKPTRMWVPPSP